MLRFVTVVGNLCQSLVKAELLSEIQGRQRTDNLFDMLHKLYHFFKLLFKLRGLEVEQYFRRDVL